MHFTYLDYLPRQLWQLKHLLALRLHLGADARQLIEGLSLAEYSFESLQNGLMEVCRAVSTSTHLNGIVALHGHELKALVVLLHLLIDVFTQLLHALCELLLDRLPVIQLRLLLELLLLGEQSQICELLNQVLDLIALLADQLGSLIVALLEINILRVEALEVLAVAGQHRLIILPQPLELGLATARDLFQSQLHLEMFEAN